jgi:anti-sigma factor RsiW
MSGHVSDEQLVAFLDGELDTQTQIEVEQALAEDAELAQRLEYLGHSTLPLQSAYAELLAQAPQERLAAMLEAMPPYPASSGMSRRRFFAAAASFMVAGIAADRLFIHWHAAANQGDKWRERVADYMALYTTETLDEQQNDEATQIAQLRTVDQQLGLSLQPAQLALPGAELKRAQVLRYDDTPIAQITYLDPDHGPLALCITLNKQGTRPIQQEQRYAMNVVYWSGTDHAFMLIGHNPFEELTAHMQLLQGRNLA